MAETIEVEGLEGMSIIDAHELQMEGRGEGKI